MLILNENQTLWLKTKLESAHQQHTVAFDKLILAAAKPGELSNKLGWMATSVMFNDLLRASLDEMMRFTRDPECKATLENMEEWYTKEVLRWYPEHSTNVTLNLEAEMKHRVNQEMMGLIQTLRSRKS